MSIQGRLASSALTGFTFPHEFSVFSYFQIIVVYLLSEKRERNCDN